MKENKEVEIVDMPIKKIVILNSTKFSIDEFFKRIELMAKTGQPIGLSWSEGIVFMFFPFQPGSDIIVEHALEGTQYWSGFSFQKCRNINPSKRWVQEKSQ